MEANKLVYVDKVFCSSESVDVFKRYMLQVSANVWN